MARIPNWAKFVLLVIFMILMVALRPLLDPPDEPRTKVVRVTATSAVQPVAARPEVSATVMDTPTAVPTSTPASTPTVTPTPAPTDIKLFVKAKNNANLRNGPGTEFDVIGTVAKNENLVLMGKNQAADWYKLHWNAWIHRDMVDVEQPVVLPVMTTIPTSTPDVAATAAVAQAAARAAAIEAYRTNAPSGTWCSEKDGVSVCVGAFRYAYEVGYWTANRGGKFVVFSARVTNRTGQRIHVNPNNYTLIDLDSAAYSYNTATFSLNTPLQAVDLQPGTKAEGALAFIISGDSGPAQIAYESGLLGPTVMVDLRREPDVK